MGAPKAMLKLFQILSSVQSFCNVLLLSIHRAKVPPEALLIFFYIPKICSLRRCFESVLILYYQISQPMLKAMLKNPDPKDLVFELKLLLWF